MSTDRRSSNNQARTEIGWKDGLLGIVAGTGAGICCLGPVVLGLVGLSGLAGTLSALPFFYHVILQWIALGIMAGAWIIFLYRWINQPEENRWNRVSVLTGGLLVIMTLYVIRSWVTHILI